MIYAKYSHRSDGSVLLSVDGHADSAPMGQDLVCAAVSILVHTAVQVVEDLKMQGRLARPPDCVCQQGRAWVLAIPVPVKEAVDAVNIALGTVGTGLKLLSQQYPNYIQLTCNG